MFKVSIIIILVILVVITFFIINYLVFNKNINMISNKSLCILVIIKNEAMVIDEWINHYIWQGVDHFYIIDNGSTDNIKDILNTYIDNGIVSYFYRDEKHKQKEHYNEIYNKYIRNNWDWVIVCDVDEYFYYRGNKNIKDYVNTLNQFEISHFVSRWKMFGSHGHNNQPQSIRKSFLTRRNKTEILVKTVINTLLTDKLCIHQHNYIGGHGIECPKQLALNHYAIMSKEYFEKIKMTRGDAHDSSHDNTRDWKYFDKYDHKEVYDTELHDLVVEYENKEY
jgi:hypothetical protein